MEFMLKTSTDVHTRAVTPSCGDCIHVVRFWNGR